MPKVSVILPVYNAEKFLKQSIDSVLTQTFSDFELIILNDGSTDMSEDIVRSYRDPRIVYSSHANCGLAATLNKGIEMAKSEFIARQDNDDISYPKRLELQYSGMVKDKDLALLGTAAEIIDENGNQTGRKHQHPTDNLPLKFSLLFDNPFVHSSVMFRKSCVIDVGYYSTDTSVFEDHELWSRLARKYKVANLSQVLLAYREVNSGMSKTTIDYFDRVFRQSKKNLYYYNETLTDDEIDILASPRQLIKLYNTKSGACSVYSELLRRFVNDFCRKENAHHMPEELILKRELNFNRFVLNEIINSTSSTKLQKLNAKLKRKILFLRYSSLLG